MELGAELIGMVKTNIKGFCKETIEKLTKNGLEVPTSC